MDTGLLLPLCAVFIFAAIIYAILEAITCLIRPGVCNEDDPLGVGHGPASRRKRLLSLYEIYKPSHQDITENPGKALSSGTKRASIPTTVETINEEADDTPPPSYAQAVSSVVLSPIVEDRNSKDVLTV